MADPTEAASLPATEPASGGLDAIISDALDTAHYGEDPVIEPVKAEPDKTEPAKTAEELKIDATGRAHAADGKYASTKPAEPEPSVVEPAKVEAATAEPVAVDPAKPQPIDPHPRWPAEFKAEFAKWPPEVQKAFKDRDGATEAEYTRKTQELAETRKAVEPLIQEVGKWSPYLRQLGLTPDQAFTQMLTTEYTLRTGTPEQKAQSLAYLAQLYGVALPNQTAGDGQQPDPAITQLHRTVSGLQSQLRQIGEQNVLNERQRAQAEFDALGQAKDVSGQLKFPHFERVSKTMIQLVASGQADTWDTAYSKSVRLDDDLYKQTVEAERNRVAAEAEKQRLEAVDKANKARPVKTSDGSPKGGTQMKGLDALISGAMERAGIGD